MTVEVITRKKVLVVEDSPTQAMHLKTLLEEAGLYVSLALNGRIGVDVARKTRPDLIVLDVQMPEMDGLQVCQVLKTMPETEVIPIIMLTAHDDLETLLCTLDLGVVGFVPKDVHADAALLGTLEQLGMLVEA